MRGGYKGTCHVTMGEDKAGFLWQENMNQEVGLRAESRPTPGGAGEGSQHMTLVQPRRLRPPGRGT